MTGRPRTISDLDILKGAANVVAEKPDSWTLADVGDVVGLCPAGVMRRFGSKAGLELALLKYLNATGTASEKLTAAALICHQEATGTGLLAFRLIAALRGNPALREAAAGVGR